MKSKSKALTILFSFCPGAGHMYLGFLQRGVQLMAIFWFSIFLISWLNLDILGFVLPVVWFYSFFDALHCFDEGVPTEGLSFDGLEFLRSHPRWIGWGLIVLGCLVAFEQGFANLIPWEWHHYIKIGLVSLILVGGGIMLLKGSNPAPDQLKEGSSCDSDE